MDDLKALFVRKRKDSKEDQELTGGTVWCLWPRKLWDPPGGAQGLGFHPGPVAFALKGGIDGWKALHLCLPLFFLKHH